MKLIVAGSRTLTLTVEEMHAHISAHYDVSEITEVVSGSCKTGIDVCGEKWAKAHGIAIVLCPADWDKHGRGAGPKRNGQMARYADAAIVFMRVGADTPGSLSMVREAAKYGIRCEIVRV